MARPTAIASYLDPERFPPAPAQGAIGIEIRADDARVAELVSPLDHGETHAAIRAERAMLKVIDGSCRTPIGVFTQRDGDRLVLAGEVLSPDGRQRFAAELAGPAGDAEALGTRLGALLIERAGPRFIARSEGRLSVRVLVTRPEPDAGDTARRLAALGCVPDVFPLTRMHVTRVRLPEPTGLSGLIVTSANALRALAERGALEAYRALPLFAVGARTAAAARAAGFAEVTSAGGDAAMLIDLVSAHAGAGTYFYPAAEETARNLPKALAASGRLVIAARVYRMEPVPRLDPAVAARLEAGELAAALVYSRRAAMLFAELTELVLSPRRRRELTLVCLSENVAAPLVSHGFVRIVLADFPSEEAMMAATLSFSRGQIAS